MAISNSSLLDLALHTTSYLCIIFGVLAIYKPADSLDFFEWEYPESTNEKQMVDFLLAVYGIRDVFMGVAAFITHYTGNRRATGFALIAIASVGFGDGAICWAWGHGALPHWSWASVVAVAGLLLTGVFDR